MDIKQISYFMAVAQEGSFSRAAEKLGGVTADAFHGC